MLRLTLRAQPRFLPVCRFCQPTGLRFILLNPYPLRVRHPRAVHYFQFVAKHSFDHSSVFVWFV